MDVEFIQTSTQLVQQGAPDFAIQAGCTEEVAGWCLVRCFAWFLKRCPEEKLPSTQNEVRGEKAAALIARGAGWKKEPELFVEAGARVEPPIFYRLEPTANSPGGWGVHGLKRYDGLHVVRAQSRERQARGRAIKKLAEAMLEADPKMGKERALELARLRYHSEQPSDVTRDKRVTAAPPVTRDNPVTSREGHVVEVEVEVKEEVPTYLPGVQGGVAAAPQARPTKRPVLAGRRSRAQGSARSARERVGGLEISSVSADEAWQRLAGEVWKTAQKAPGRRPAAFDAWWADIATEFSPEAVYEAARAFLAAGLAREDIANFIKPGFRWRVAKAFAEAAPAPVVAQHQEPEEPQPVMPPCADPAAQAAWDGALGWFRDKGMTYALSWLVRLGPIAVREQTLVVWVADRYFRDWMRDHYGESLERALQIATRSALTSVELQVGESAAA